MGSGWYSKYRLLLPAGRYFVNYMSCTVPGKSIRLVLRNS
jgi:hypothetical protein